MSVGPMRSSAPSIAPPLPEVDGGATSTLAPAAAASRTVSSVDEPSTTTTSSTNDLMAPTVRPTRPASFRAAISAVTRVTARGTAGWRRP
jgi:hypothetical protein